MPNVQEKVLTASERRTQLAHEINEIWDAIRTEEEIWGKVCHDWALDQGWCPDCDARSSYNGTECKTCKGQSKPGIAGRYDLKMMIPAHKEYIDLYLRKAPLEFEQGRIEFFIRNPAGKRCLLLCKSAVINGQRVRINPGTTALCVRRHRNDVHVNIDGLGESVIRMRDIDMIEW